MFDKKRANAYVCILSIKVFLFVSFDKLFFVSLNLKSSMQKQGYFHILAL